MLVIHTYLITIIFFLAKFSISHVIFLTYVLLLGLKLRVDHVESVLPVQEKLTLKKILNQEVCLNLFIDFRQKCQPNKREDINSF